MARKNNAAAAATYFFLSNGSITILFAYLFRTAQGHEVTYGITLFALTFVAVSYFAWRIYKK